LARSFCVECYRARVIDPLQPLFGMASRELFAQPALTASRGPLERFPEFMRSGPLESIEALCRDYSGSLEVAGGSASDGLQFPVSGAHPSALLRSGLTVYFSDLQRMSTAAQAWLRSLEASLGLPECASLVGFANASGSGLTLHHDRYDQLFFQIQGRKTFRWAQNHFLREPDIQFSPGAAAHADFGSRYRLGFPGSNAEVLEASFQTLELEPGGAFFMPAGTWHTTAEQPEESLSLAVAVRAPSRLNLLLNLLQYYLGQSPHWRARSYGGWHEQEDVAFRAHEPWAPLLADLTRRLPSLPASAAHDAWSLHGFTVGSQSRYPIGAHFERFIRLPNSSLEMEMDAALGKLRCVVLSGPNIRPQARTVIGINPEARGLIDWILASHAAFTVQALCGAFPDFEPAEVEELLALLASAALIRPIPAPDWVD
jgi:hypothetical protein